MKIKRFNANFFNWVLITCIVSLIYNSLCKFYAWHSPILLQIALLLLLLSKILIIFFGINIVSSFYQKTHYDYEVKIPLQEEDNLFLSVYNKKSFFIFCFFLILAAFGFIYLKSNIFSIKNFLIYIVYIILWALDILTLYIFKKMLLCVNKYKNVDITGEITSAIYLVKEDNRGCISEIKRQPYKISEKEENYNDLIIMKAITAYRTGNFSKTISLIEKIDTDNYKEPELFAIISNCYFKLNQNENALIFINKALILKQQDTDILMQKAYILCNLGHFDKALKILLQLENLGIKDNNFYELISSVYINIQEYSKALLYADKALKLNSKSKEAIELKNSCLAAINKEEKNN